MEEERNKGIKEVIKKYPGLEGILKDYDINCAQCDGDCKMKDVFEEHNLSMKDEMELMSRISEEVK